VGFAAEEFEIFASLGILELFHVCIITGIASALVFVKPPS